MVKWLGLFVIIIFTLSGCERPSVTPPHYTLVKIEKTIMLCEVSNTEASRVQGLSDRLSLPATQGMLFIYDEPEKILRHWMKNMHFPIDMIWINAKHQIVAIDADAPICTHTPCAVYSSKKPAKYVLEVNAGFAAAHHIQPGMLVAMA